MSDRSAFEKIYTRPGAAIWTLPEPPKELVDFLTRGGLPKGSSVLDCGCGEGTAANYMSSMGMNVLGVDFMLKAVEWARDNAQRSGSSARFHVLNVADLDRLADLDFPAKYDFVFEWGLIHHLPSDQDVRDHIARVSHRLKQGGLYMSVCFNSDDVDYAQRGLESYVTPLGTEIRYHSAEEMHRLYMPYFEEVESKRITVGGKDVWHPANYFLLRKPHGA